MIATQIAGAAVSAPAAVDSPVYGFLRNPSMVDYAGHLSAVFFLSGCNFGCGFCHNARLMGRRRAGLSWTRLAETCRRFRENWADAAVITGGEPTLSAGLVELIAFLRQQGWFIKLDTNGSNPKRLERCLPLVDYVAMDVKASPLRYPYVVGYSGVDRIAASVSLIREHAADYEFRTTVIEPVHDDDQMRQIGELIRGARRYVLQPFVPKPGLPDASYESYPRTTPQRLNALHAIMAEYCDKVEVRGA